MKPEDIRILTENVHALPSFGPSFGEELFHLGEKIANKHFADSLDPLQDPLTCASLYRLANEVETVEHLSPAALRLAKHPLGLQLTLCHQPVISLFNQILEPIVDEITKPGAGLIFSHAWLSMELLHKVWLGSNLIF
jgi:hypothetical protein